MLLDWLSIVGIDRNIIFFNAFDKNYNKKKFKHAETETKAEIEIESLKIETYLH